MRKAFSPERVVHFLNDLAKMETDLAVGMRHRRVNQEKDGERMKPGKSVKNYLISYCFSIFMNVEFEESKVKRIEQLGIW